MDEVRTIKRVQDLLRHSDYNDFFLSLNTQDQRSLAIILDDRMHKFAFPEEIIKSRARAMSQNDYVHIQGINSISKYLSPREDESLSPSVAMTVNRNLESQAILASTAPIVYAMIAEVLVVKGEDRVLEVIEELDYLKQSGGLNDEESAATALIISEALKPEADDYPFAWFAQLSPHAWVLTSDKSSALVDFLRNLVD